MVVKYFVTTTLHFVNVIGRYFMDIFESDWQKDLVERNLGKFL